MAEVRGSSPLESTPKNNGCLTRFLALLGRGPNSFSQVRASRGPDVLTYGGRDTAHHLSVLLAYRERHVVLIRAVDRPRSLLTTLLPSADYETRGTA
jgi:hypothetical protein